MGSGFYEEEARAAADGLPEAGPCSWAGERGLRAWLLAGLEAPEQQPMGLGLGWETVLGREAHGLLRVPRVLQLEAW